MEEVITVKKFNEVYNKIICDPGIAMELNEYYTFDVPGAKFMPTFKNKVWDGKIRIFNPMSCLLYTGLTENLEQFCNSRNYKLEFENYTHDTEFSLVEAKNFIDKLQPKYQPRDYQLQAFVHAIRKGRCFLLSPTGSGKSLMIYLISCFYRSKTLIIVPTTSLVHQLASDFVKYGLPENLIHKIMSGKEKETDCPFVISTWQSIHKLNANWFNKFDVVIGDEAHLFKAKSLTSIMTKLTDCKHKFGFSGTLDGSEVNKLVLEGLFGPIKKVTTTSELMEKKHLADLKIKAIVLNYSNETKKLVSGFDYQQELDFLVRNESRNRFIKNLALSQEGNTLVFFQFVEKQGKPLYEMIKAEAKNRKVFFISGEIDGDTREEIRKILETETNAIVVASSGTTSTGWDVPNLRNAIFASPSKSRVRNLQSIGRTLRRTDEKTTATLYDIADDLTQKKKMNSTLLHFVERVKIYNQEQFSYKVYKVSLDS